ncbi:hypothetical protein [Novacetimonas hansenii]|nr:hypothetical protein [Novacetimonas hansenii]
MDEKKGAVLHGSRPRRVMCLGPWFLPPRTGTAGRSSAYFVAVLSDAAA